MPLTVKKVDTENPLTAVTVVPALITNHENVLFPEIV